ncbi:MAG: DUF2630 family protein [Chitinophagaceae bacterium]|nr:MAG: DUF2630 family protein [Chitinophagaceae bacterium]
MKRRWRNASVRFELDQSRDLLRQQRAFREAGEDSETTKMRSSDAIKL